MIADSCFCGAAFNLPAKECAEGHYMTAAEVETFELRQALRDVLTLVDESRRLFHDSTVWEDEEYVEPHDIAKRWAAVRALVRQGEEQGEKR